MKSFIQKARAGMIQSLWVHYRYRNQLMRFDKVSAADPIVQSLEKLKSRDTYLQLYLKHKLSLPGSDSPRAP